MEKRVKKWLGTVNDCDLCQKPIEGEFVDGQTTFGPWALMCQRCFSVFGRGLGLGRGQQYQRVGKEFLKVAGQREKGPGRRFWFLQRCKK